MTIKNADKSAMPSQALGTDGLPTHEAEFGLTKREMMAMHMMASVMLRNDVTGTLCDFAEVATEAADTLLAALERTK